MLSKVVTSVNVIYQGRIVSDWVPAIMATQVTPCLILVSVFQETEGKTALPALSEGATSAFPIQSQYHTVGTIKDNCILHPIVRKYLWRFTCFMSFPTADLCFPPFSMMVHHKLTKISRLIKYMVSVTPYALSSEHCREALPNSNAILVYSTIPNTFILFRAQ
jgi:hypothetical protein